MYHYPIDAPRITHRGANLSGHETSCPTNFRVTLDCAHEIKAQALSCAYPEEHARQAAIAAWMDHAEKEGVSCPHCDKQRLAMRSFSRTAAWQYRKDPQGLDWILSGDLYNLLLTSGGGRRADQWANRPYYDVWR